MTKKQKYFEEASCNKCTYLTIKSMIVNDVEDNYIVCLKHPEQDFIQDCMCRCKHYTPHNYPDNVNIRVLGAKYDGTPIAVRIKYEVPSTLDFCN